MSAPPATLPFERCARLPAAGDNVAIATRRIEPGTEVERDGSRFRVAHTVLEGHRLVVEPIRRGAPLLSWGRPFGLATRDLAPGEYVCNARVLAELGGRAVDLALPERPSFEDHRDRDLPAPEALAPGRQVEPVAAPGTFRGFRRPGGRGVGTRNHVVVLATTSDAGAFAEAVAARFRGAARRHPGLDGVVAVTHTEGGGADRPLNLPLVLRTLSGFLVHPNVAAVLAVDLGTGSYTNATLQEWCAREGYPLEHVPHAFQTVEGGFEAALAQAVATVEGFLPAAAAAVRTEEPLADLRLALQCGGSDAFSGVSGNALAGWVAKELIRHGGSANLAETDELIGAEPYVLANVRDADTARRFLATVARFEERAALHGASAEGNPSGGNLFRGLYNISLKSLGAARKKHPDVRLDRVIEYGEPMGPGEFCFMDSPGNDLESIAGQVASGANLILFITGNGSITNFPFVPTLKFVTTTGRFELLANEMDVNAGRYNDGESMEDLGADTFALACRTASGAITKGERAGHAQVSLWRAWRQRDDSGLRAARVAKAPDGLPLAAVAAAPARLALEGYRVEPPVPGAPAFATDQVALVLPTSLCSGQIARLAAERLNERDERPGGISRFVALPHTEGCGSANAEELLLETFAGHLLHPFTRRALLLEHGCEKTHNDAATRDLARRGVSLARLGTASVQLDGGIERVLDRMTGWFDAALAADGAPERATADAAALRLGVHAAGPVGAEAARALGRLCAGLVAAGATVVVPETAAVLAAPAFRTALLAAPDRVAPTLAYGQRAARPGLHVMAAPSTDASEVLTGLGGTGVEVMLAHVGAAPLQANPMVPLLQVASDPAVVARFGPDLDLVLAPEHLAGEGAPAVEALLRRIEDTASRRYAPRLSARGYASFQLSRGLLGISL